MGCSAGDRSARAPRDPTARLTAVTTYARWRTPSTALSAYPLIAGGIGRLTSSGGVTCSALAAFSHAPGTRPGFNAQVYGFSEATEFLPVGTTLDG
jgi:hypothetical protein